MVRTIKIIYRKLFNHYLRKRRIILDRKFLFFKEIMAENQPEVSLLLIVFIKYANNFINISFLVIFLFYLL